MKLGNADRFSDFIERSEQRADVSAVSEKRGAMIIRRYSFDAPATKSPSGMALLVANDAEYSVITVSLPLDDPTLEGSVLGYTKPNQSIADITLLDDIQSDYQFHPAYLGYLNHIEIIRGLTVANGNDFGRMLDTLVELTKRRRLAAAELDESTDDGSPDAVESSVTPEQDTLVVFRTPACRTELLAIVETWPKTVIGYTEFELAGNPQKIFTRMVVESRDSALMQELGALRGFVPGAIRSVGRRPMLAVGIGLNIDALVPFLAGAIQRVSQKAYQCEFLARAQRTLVEANPTVALGLFSGIFAGLQGVSATVLDVEASFDIDQPSAIPDIESIDALIAISTPNPQGLVMMASSFMRGMPPLEVPADGTPLDFPLPLPVPGAEQVKLAIQGSHLVAYVGNKGEQTARRLALEPLAKNGLVLINMNYGKYLKTIATATNAGLNETPKSAKSRAVLEKIPEIDAQIVESVDFSPKGIVFDVDMTKYDMEMTTNNP